MKNTKPGAAKTLKVDKNFTPCPIDKGDELFQNGIFVFNITKMIDFIQQHPSKFVPESIAVEEHYTGFNTINEDHLGSCISSGPVLLAEISPGMYNLVDGNHRMEKAHRAGKEAVMAYTIGVDDHIKFLTTHNAYKAYVEYWNSKLKQLRKYLQM